MSRTGRFFVIMRCDLKSDPAVLEMAEALKTRPETVVGYLHSVWSWWCQQTTTDRVDGMTLDSLGVATNLSGFPQIMESVGWIKSWRDDNGRPFLTIPNHERWLEGVAARRQFDRDRKRKQRAQQDLGDVLDNVLDDVSDECGLQKQKQKQRQETTETDQLASAVPTRGASDGKALLSDADADADADAQRYHRALTRAVKATRAQDREFLYRAAHVCARHAAEHVLPDILEAMKRRRPNIRSPGGYLRKALREQIPDFDELEKRVNIPSAAVLSVINNQ